MVGPNVGEGIGEGVAGGELAVAEGETTTFDATSGARGDSAGSGAVAVAVNAGV